MRSRLLFCVVFAAGCGDDTSPSTPASPSLCQRAAADDLVLDDASAVAGAMSVSVVSGDLLVCNTGIGTLSLPALTHVHGNVVVFANESLSAIELPLLETVGTQPGSTRSWVGLLLEGNSVLTEVDAPRLRIVAHHVWVADNNLTTFDLPALSLVDGALALRATRVTAVDGFANLRFVKGAIAFYDNEALIEVTGLANLVSVSAELVVRDNTVLTTVALPTLSVVGGDVEIADVPELTVLNLPNVSAVGRDLALVNTALADLSGLAGLETVAGGLAITHHDHLETAALPALAHLGGDLMLADNAMVSGVTVDELVFLGNNLTIRDNNSLAILGFPNLAEVAGCFNIVNNTVLPTCTAENLRDVIGTENIGGNVSITGNDDVASCP